MDSNLEQKLYNIDPVFFEQAIKCQVGQMTEMNTCMYFGCQCGDGWFEPIKKFVHKVKIINEQAKQYNSKFVCSQLKEKFGQIRVYYKLSKINDNINSDHQQQIDCLANMFEDALRKVEEDCWNVCEWCGADGGRDGENLITTSGWISRICKKCSKKSIEKNTKRFDEQNHKEYQPRITLFKQGYNFLSMFCEVGFYYNNDYFNSIVEAYACSKDHKHKQLYKMIYNYSKNSSYIIYQLFTSYGFELQQNDYDLIKQITFARFTHKCNKKSLSQLLQTVGYRLSNMGRHCNNIYGYCVCDKCKNVQHKDLYAKILMQIREQLFKENNNKPDLLFWKDSSYYTYDKQNKELQKVKPVQLMKVKEKLGITDKDVKILF